MVALVCNEVTLERNATQRPAESALPSGQSQPEWSSSLTSLTQDTHTHTCLCTAKHKVCFLMVIPSIPPLCAYMRSPVCICLADLPSVCVCEGREWTLVGVSHELLWNFIRGPAPSQWDQP